MPKRHEPVLRDEVLRYLNAKREGLIVDGTIGDGGHTHHILKNTESGLRVLGIDRDPNAIGRAEKRLASFRERVRLIHGNYSQLPDILNRAGIAKIDGLLLDLGVSSPQLDSPERGFSFLRDGPLDCRMDPTQKTTAADLLKTLSDAELAFILRTYGEERYYRRVIREIRNAQAKGPIETTLRLSQILSRAVPSPRHAKIHPATRTFQALRIAVNNELEHLKTALRGVIQFLNAGARVLVISFHSLEDRIVKTFFRDEEKGCVCPPKMPVCICGKKSSLKIITRKPVPPSPEEVARNPRASSAKLRVAERVYV